MPREEMSELEKERAANMAERDALLKKLKAEAESIGVFPGSTVAKATAKKKPTPKKPKKVVQEQAPRRTSARLAGLTADSEVAKRKADDRYEEAKRAAEAKRVRVSGDLNMGDIVVGGQWERMSLGDGLTRGKSAPFMRTFGENDIKTTTDKELKALREKMSGLQLWRPWEPNRIKITPERIYAMSFHPTESKPLIFAGDKVGNLGILDGSQNPQTSNNGIKREDAAEDEEAEEDPDPIITTIKPHSRTISAMHIHPADPSKLYTASYDSSIRALDLEKSVATEAYAPASTSTEEPLSGVDMAPDDPHVLYFTTLDGVFGRYDTRTQGSGNKPDVYALSEKKIGGFSLCPSQPHYLAMASLDRTMRLWDLRKLSKKNPTPVGEHESSLSVSHAAFNSVGQVATSSYDNSLKVYDFSAKGLHSWAAGHRLSAEDMEPSTVLKHNCQTGKWVTILRPQWQAAPQDGVQRFCIGNMSRFVDIYTSDGNQLAQLGGEGLITAVPAVAVFHRSQNWVVGGTGSGKVCLWM